MIQPKKRPKPAKKTRKKAATKGGTKRTKKVYEMPGQKKDTPPELDGARIFYESLLKQNPDSKMAVEYLLKFGLLPRERAEKEVASQDRAKGRKPGGARTVKKAKTKKKKSEKLKA